MAPLPSAYAFLVQLGRETDFRKGFVLGQVEHLVSGRQGRFASREEMLAFMDATLAAVMAPATEHPEPRAGGDGRHDAIAREQE